MRSSTKSGQWTEPGKSQAPWRFSELRRLVSDPKTLKFDDQRLALLGHVSDLYELLRVIDETMPADATLYLEGTSIAADIKVFLSHRSATVQQEVEAGTRWPKPRVFHLPLSGTDLAELRALAEHHAEPEICDHLVVYREGDVLLWAHDAGSGLALVSQDLPAEMVSRLKATLGG